VAVVSAAAFDPAEEERWFDEQVAANGGKVVSGESDGKKKRSQASELVDLAVEMFRIGVASSGEPFAVPRDGPLVARMLRGGRDSLRAHLAAMYAASHDRAPSASALADALLVLEGRAQQEQPEPLHLRVARHDDALVIDLADATGDAIIIRPGAWTVAPSPVLFRRTELTAPLPRPASSGDLAPLWALLPVAEESRPLLMAWLLLALDPDVAHPVLAFVGEQGTGKSSTERVVASIIDPSPAPLRAMPRDLDQWATAASASYTVPLDNVSDLPGWLSDALCRAATGDGLLKRRLYSDADVVVLTFRRAVLLSSIDVGMLRGDLGERLLPIELDSIPATSRRTDSDLATAWDDAHPTVLAGVCDLAARLLEVLPTVRLDVLPRMADYGLWLAGLDRILGTSGVAQYATTGVRIAEDVAESDPVTIAIRTFIDATGEWSGSVTDLLGLLGEVTSEEQRRARGWPKTPRALGGRIRRSAPALRTLGYRVTVPKRSTATGRAELTLGARDQREGANDGSDGPNGRAEGEDRDLRDHSNGRLQLLSGFDPDPDAGNGQREAVRDHSNGRDGRGANGWDSPATCERCGTTGTRVTASGQLCEPCATIVIHGTQGREA